MLASFGRKLRQLGTDPVLRHWLVARALRRHAPPPPFVPGRPPYVTAWPAPAAGQAPGWAVLPADLPRGSVTLPLPGATVTVTPAQVAGLFDRCYADGETLSALHRFAWLPLLGDAVDSAWVTFVWQVWRTRFATPADGPAWEAYSATERALNLLDYGRRIGLPGPLADSVTILAAHAPAIADRLEYEGEDATHNLLDIKGRGLYRLGVDLNMPEWADQGATELRHEAQRLFQPSGVLREGSSHYHVLYVRNIADVFLCARRHQRPEEGEWRRLLQRLMAVVPRLVLPGGLPLVGDVSPDSPPGFLAGLLPGGRDTIGWTGLLDADDYAALAEISGAAGLVEGSALAADGWLRADHGRWSGLWHAAPAGWCFSPGHGHQDVGACELHWDDIPVFIDPGRGAYGEDGEAALYRSGAVHGGLSVDGADPYPVNKPYYHDDFRRIEGGPPPVLSPTGDGVTLAFGGFGRLGRVGKVTRQWHFRADGFTLTDHVAGRGCHSVVRRLVTPLAARMEGGAIRLEGPGLALRVTADTPLTLRPLKRWIAYGISMPATLIEAASPARLPYAGTLTVEVL